MKKDTKTSSKLREVDTSDLNKEEVKEIKTNNSSKRNKLYISFVYLKYLLGISGSLSVATLSESGRAERS